MTWPWQPIRRRTSLSHCRSSSCAFGNSGTRQSYVTTNMVRRKGVWSGRVLRSIVQDTPLDDVENPGIEGKGTEDPYAGSPNEEYADEYDDGWFVGKGQHKGKNSHANDHEEGDVVEVSSKPHKTLRDKQLIGEFSLVVGERQEKPGERSRPRDRFWSRRLLRWCSPRKPRTGRGRR